MSKDKHKLKDRAMQFLIDIKAGNPSGMYCKNGVKMTRELQYLLDHNFVRIEKYYSSFKHNRSRHSRIVAIDL